MPWVWEEQGREMLGIDLSDSDVATCEIYPRKCQQVMFSDEELANKMRCGRPK